MILSGGGAGCPSATGSFLAVENNFTASEVEGAVFFQQKRCLSGNKE